jgi:hypothetical protein
MYSYISRHYIVDKNHQYFFLIHDILIPIFLVSLVVQFNNKKNLHKILGKFLSLVLIPLLIISGYLLSMYSKKKIIFQSYGLSFFTLNLEMMNQYMKINYKLIKCFHFISILFYMNAFMYIFSTFNENYDFLLILFCVPILHYLSIIKKRKHKFHAYNLLYISLLGTVYSFTKDVYWLRKEKLNPVFRNIINNIPFYVLLYVQDWK